MCWTLHCCWSTETCKLQCLPRPSTWLVLASVMSVCTLNKMYLHLWIFLNCYQCYTHCYSGQHVHGIKIKQHLWVPGRKFCTALAYRWSGRIHLVARLRRASPRVSFRSTGTLLPCRIYDQALISVQFYYFIVRGRKLFLYCLCVIVYVKSWVRVLFTAGWT